MKGRITKTGYRRNSPDVGNDFNIIPSNRISMKNVDFPVLGIDNLGNTQLMHPGEEYEYQGDYVTELPMYGSGGLTQWFAEEWVDIKTGKKCGRSGKDKKGRPYPACRPSKRVNKTTPKTKGEMSAAEKAKFKRKKKSGKRIDYNHKRAQLGIEVNSKIQVDPEMMFRNLYNTELTASEKKEFDKWVAEESKRQGRNILMDMGAYDVQGFWKSGDYKRMDQDNHGTDTWKKPNHPTFSNQSKYHGADGFYGGNWKADGGYQPSKQTLELYGTGYYDWMFGLEPNRPEYLDASRYESGVNKPTPLYYKKGGSLPKAQGGGRPGQVFQEVDTYIKPVSEHTPNWAQVPKAAVNYTFGKNLISEEPRFSLGYQGVDVVDEINYSLDAVGSIGLGAGVRKGKNFRPVGENLRAGLRGKYSFQGIPGNVIKRLFGEGTNLDQRFSFEGEAGLAYANGAVRPYLSHMPQTNIYLNDNLYLGLGFEQRGRYDRNWDETTYGNTITGTIVPVAQRDAYSGMGRGAKRFSLNYNFGDGDYIQAYYSKPDPFFMGSIGVRDALALETNLSPRFGVRLKKSFAKGGSLPSYQTRGEVPNKILNWQDDAEWFNNRAVFSDNPRYNDTIKKLTLAGTHGYNPSTGTLHKLDTPVNVDPEIRYNVTQGTAYGKAVDDYKSLFREDKKNNRTVPVTIPKEEEWNPLPKDQAELLSGKTVYMTPENADAFNKASVSRNTDWLYNESIGFKAPGIGFYSAAAPWVLAADAAVHTGNSIYNNDLKGAALNSLGLLPFVPSGFRGLKKGYNAVATGNSALPRAWKLENSVVPKSAQYIKGPYTKAQSELLADYGRGMNLTPEQWKLLEEFTRSGATQFSGDFPISRVLGYYSGPTAEAQAINNLRIGQTFAAPAEKTIRTWSAGLPSSTIVPENATRLVIPSRYTKNLGNNFAGMNYGDKANNFIWQVGDDGMRTLNTAAVGEKELLGNLPDGFRVIGKVNSGGFNNIIIRPRTVLNNGSFHNQVRRIANRPYIRNLSASDAIPEYVDGIFGGLDDIRLNNRPFFETFPVTTSQRLKVSGMQDAAASEADAFVKAYTHDGTKIQPWLQRKIQEWDPQSSYQFNLRNQPHLRNKQVRLTDTRKRFANPNLSEDATTAIWQRRNYGEPTKRSTADGFAYFGPSNPDMVTFRNRGFYYKTPKEVAGTVVHEGAHGLPQSITNIQGLPFGNAMSQWSPEANYFINRGYYADYPVGSAHRISKDVLIKPNRNTVWHADPKEFDAEKLRQRWNVFKNWQAQGWQGSPQTFMELESQTINPFLLDKNFKGVNPQYFQDYYRQGLSRHLKNPNMPLSEFNTLNKLFSKGGSLESRAKLK